LQAKAEKKKAADQKVIKTTAELKTLTSKVGTPKPTLQAKKTAL